MKTKENKKDNLVTIPESTLLTLVAARLEGRVLFPKKVESAKRILENMKRVPKYL